MKVKIYHESREMLIKQSNDLLSIHHVVNICFEDLDHKISFVDHFNRFLYYSFQFYFILFYFLQRIKISKSPVFIIALQQLRFYFYNLRVVKNEDNLVPTLCRSESNYVFLIIIAGGIPFYSFIQLWSGCFNDFPYCFNR